MTLAAALSILVIDDEFDVAVLLAELLAARGHRVATAINGQIGKAMLMSQPFDLVITDFMMPVVDGLELARCMRAEPKLAGIPIILISARIDGVASDGHGLVQAMLQKPFSPKALYAAIDDVTARAEV